MRRRSAGRRSGADVSQPQPDRHPLPSHSVPFLPGGYGDRPHRILHFSQPPPPLSWSSGFHLIRLLARYGRKEPLDLSSFISSFQMLCLFFSYYSSLHIFSFFLFSFFFPFPFCFLYIISFFPFFPFLFSLFHNFQILLFYCTFYIYDKQIC